MSKKGNVTVVTPVASISSTQLKDDVLAVALANGYTEADVQRLERQDAYRREYNQRPEVRAKRALYSKARYERMKTLRSLLR